MNVNVAKLNPVRPRPHALYSLKRRSYSISSLDLIIYGSFLHNLPTWGVWHHRGERPHRHHSRRTFLPSQRSGRASGIHIHDGNVLAAQDRQVWHEERVRQRSGVATLSWSLTCPRVLDNGEGDSDGEQGRSSGGLYLGAQRSQIWYPHLVSFYWVLWLVLSYSRYTY